MCSHSIQMHAFKPLGFTVNTAEFNMTSLKLAKYGASLEQYRGAIVSCNCLKYTYMPANRIRYYFAALIGRSNLLIAIITLSLRLSNHIELNPGLDVEIIQVCHIKILGLHANFSDLLTLVSHLYDIICIQETMMSNEVSDDDLRIYFG